MKKPFLYAIQVTGRHYWRVEFSQGPVGPCRQVAFSRKSRAEAFLRATQKELRRTKRVDFLVSPAKLIDAIEALKLFDEAGISGRSKLRRAASLYLLCHEDPVAKEAAAYVEPESRQLELPPVLFRGLNRLARERNVDLGDLVAGLMWKFMKEEIEKEVKKHEYPNEDRIPLRMLL